MHLERIEIRNYRCLWRTVLADLPPLAVVIGANGAGKSTLFEALGFLRESLTSNAAAAVARRGGFRELRTHGQSGPVALTLRLRESGGRRATYRIEVAERDGRVVIRNEVLRYRRGSRGRPWRFLAFSNGSGGAVTNESAYGQPDAEPERRSFRLDDPSVPALKGLGPFRDFPVVSELRNFIETWSLPDSRFAAARPDAGAEPASAARSLHENHRDRFDRIVEALRARVPGLDSVEARPTEAGGARLRFRDRSFDEPFSARRVSDGTLRMFSTLLSLHDPARRGLLALDEPQTHLHPKIARRLAADLRESARNGGQVLAATHSPAFLDGARLDEVFRLEKRNGVSAARRASDDDLLRRLTAEGDLPGALWTQGLLTRDGPH